MKTTRSYVLMLITFGMLVFVLDSFTQQPYSIPEPVPPPLTVREAFNLDQFYQQWIDVDGFPILASKEVSPYAVMEVAWLIHQITRHSPAALQAMVQNKVRFSIIAHNERTTEIPEHSIHPEPHFFYDIRNRGGYCPRCLTVSAPEETILDEWWYSVTIHEFAHAFHEAGLNTIDPTFDDRLRTTYSAAMESGLWQNTYASTNKSEYWAQGVGTWFHANPNFQSVTTRTALKNYDPGLASLLTEVFGDSAWRYTLPATRTHLSHLRGFNPQNAPRLKHPSELLETYKEFTSNPDNDGGGKWVNLNPYNPSHLPNLNKARKIGDSISIYFMNHTGVTVSVYRVQLDGEEIYHANMIPGNFSEIRVNIGDILLVKDDTGEELVAFLVDEKKRGLIVRAFVGTPDSTPTTVMDRITISEIMVASNEGRLPQWIELHNLSDTHAVNLQGWTLEIQNYRSVNFNGHQNVTITFKEKSIKPQETLLIVSKQGRSSNRFRNKQIYNLSMLHPNLQDIVLSEEGFYLKLSSTAGELIDEVGNLDGKRNANDKPAWPLPTSMTEDGVRASMIRRQDNGTSRLGTEAFGWISAVNTKLTTATTTYYGHPDDIGAPGVESGGALPVQLSRFRAEHTDAGVLLKWTTESELNNAGFNILRSETKNGKFKIVNPQLIQGAGTTSERHTYTWMDTTAKPNIVYYYRIEDISHAGVRKQLATVRMRGYVSASGKLTTKWGDLKVQE